jgi:hypothetical protein
MLTTLRDILERFVFDPSLIDLVVWFPYLSWHDFAVSVATVVAWRMVSERMERYASYYLRRACADGLLRLALLVRPDTPYAPPRRPAATSERASARSQGPRIAVQRGFYGPMMTTR